MSFQVEYRSLPWIVPDDSRTTGFREDAQVEVRLGIDQEARRFIREDALAKIGSDGLIGSRHVVLYGGTPDAPAIKEGGVLMVAVTSSTEEMIAILQESNANLLAITTDLKGITGEIAAGHRLALDVQRQAEPGG